MTGPPQASVERVREELRKLGYLETGLDRFVLGGAAAASPVSACARVAARVGALGGLLGGAAFTAAAALLDPARLHDPVDLLVLMGYVAIAAGATLALFALASGLLAAWIGRRVGRRPGPMLSRNVGLALAAGGAAYLGLWWQSHARLAPPAVQVMLALAGAAVVVALTRFGSLAAVAVLAAGGVADRVPEARSARRHMAHLAGVFLLLLAGAALLASRLSKERAEGPDFAVRPTGLRVRVIGIDGFDSSLALQMVERGAMPNLEHLLAVGAHARLVPEPEQVPAIVWTTIATGRGPDAHGIRAAGARRLYGMKTAVFGTPEGRLGTALAAAADLLRITRTEPPSSVLRTVKTFWNVAESKGLRVGVVNWWATWPAEPLTGYLVSDRTFFKLERGEPFDREVYPREAERALQGLLPDSGERARRLDSFYAAAAVRLRAAYGPDLEALYLPGLDIFTSQQMSGAPAEDLGALDARLSAIREYYGFLDTLLAPADTRGANEVVLLVADPGRHNRQAASGLLVAAGSPVRAGDIGTVSERDVAPTVLHLAGLPVSDEMDGHVLEAALVPSFAEAHPVRHVSRFGERRVARAASGFDHEMIEELRSLGYIE